MNNVFFFRYAASLRETANDATFVLFHVQPTISQYLLDEARTKPGANAKLKKLMQKNHQSTQTLQISKPSYGRETKPVSTDFLHTHEINHFSDSALWVAP